MTKQICEIGASGWFYYKERLCESELIHVIVKLITSLGFPAYMKNIFICTL